MIRRIKLSENPAYAREGSMTPDKTLMARAMIAAAMIGRILNKIAAIVVIKIVKRCQVWNEIWSGGGTNQMVRAKSVNNSTG
jgi:hypothetical protein